MDRKLVRDLWRMKTQALAIAFVIAGGVAVHLQAVEIGQTNGDLAEVLSGLKPGDPVVLHPNPSVADGARVRSRPQY